MKGRLFEPLGSDLNGLIMRYLNGIDLSLARVVCKSWSSIIPPQRPTFEKDFCELPNECDRMEYIVEMERCIVFPSTLVDCWEDAKKKQLVDQKAAVLTLFFYYRKIDLSLSFRLILKSCFPKDFDSVLLPLLMISYENRDEMFWYAVYCSEKNMLQWMYEKNLHRSDLRLLNSSHCIQSYQLTDKIMDTLEWLHTTKKMSSSFWKAYSKVLWTKSPYLTHEKINYLIRLARICQYLPEEACSQVWPDQHEKIIDMCGCEPVVTYKKKQKVV